MSDTHVADLRAKTTMSPVNQEANAPKWLDAKIRSAAKTLFPEKYHGGYKGSSTGYILYKLLDHLADKEKLMAHCACRDPFCDHTELYDHSGTTIIDQRECYVLEPYPYTNDKSEYEAALDTATRDLSLVLGCRVTWEPNSWHYPEHAYRILFQETNEFD